MTPKEEAAVGYFKDHFNCAQSVVGAFCEDCGVDRESAFKLASGLGGGYRCGEVCGAASGAVMVIGLRCGQYLKGDLAQKNICYAKTLKYMESFAEQNGSYLCRDLLGYDMRDVSAREANKEKQREICPKFIESAVRLLESGEFD